MQADANRTPDRIDALPGLGPKSRDMLAAAGITTPAQLQALGSVRAYARVRARPGNNASLNLLWALEGALTGLPWRVVAQEHRLSLLLALEALHDDAATPQRPARRLRSDPRNSSNDGVK